MVLTFAGLAVGSLGLRFPLCPSFPFSLGSLEELAIEVDVVQVVPERSPRGPQASSMPFPPTGGPPPERGPRSGSREAMLSKGPLKQCGSGRKDSSTAGATGKTPLEAQSRLTSQLPPDAREQHKPPSKGAVLEPKWLLSLSLSLSLSGRARKVLENALSSLQARNVSVS